MFGRKKKKVEAPVAVEKPTVSISEMKVKFKLFDNKVKEYIKRQQAIADKHIQRATELKLRGLDATDAIKRVAFFQAKIRVAEKRRYMLEMQIENYETMEFEKEFLSTIGDMVGVLGSIDIDPAEIEAVAKNVMSANMKLASQQENMNAKMDEIDAAFSSIDALSGSDSLEGVERSINSIIDQTISDAKFSTGGTDGAELSADDIARSVINKLKVEE